MQKIDPKTNDFDQGVTNNMEKIPKNYYDVYMDSLRDAIRQDLFGSGGVSIDNKDWNYDTSDYTAFGVRKDLAKKQLDNITSSFQKESKASDRFKRKMIWFKNQHQTGDPEQKSWTDDDWERAYWSFSNTYDQQWKDDGYGTGESIASEGDGISVSWTVTPVYMDKISDRTGSDEITIDADWQFAQMLPIYKGSLRGHFRNTQPPYEYSFWADFKNERDAEKWRKVLRESGMKELGVKIDGESKASEGACPRCKGKGNVYKVVVTGITKTRPDGDGIGAIKIECPECGGTGEISTESRASEDSEMYECPYCEFYTNTNSLVLKDHIKRAHRNRTAGGYDQAPEDRSVNTQGRRHSFGWSNVYPSSEVKANELTVEQELEIYSHNVDQPNDRLNDFWDFLTRKKAKAKTEARIHLQTDIKKKWLERCEVCGDTRASHTIDIDHKFEVDATGVEFVDRGNVFENSILYKSGLYPKRYSKEYISQQTQYEAQKWWHDNYAKKNGRKDFRHMTIIEKKKVFLAYLESVVGYGATLPKYKSPHKGGSFDKDVMTIYETLRRNASEVRKVLMEAKRVRFNNPNPKFWWNADEMRTGTVLNEYKSAGLEWYSVNSSGQLYDVLKDEAELVANENKPVNEMSDDELLSAREYVYGTYRNHGYMRMLEAEIKDRGLGNPNFKKDWKDEGAETRTKKAVEADEDSEKLLEDITTD